MTFLDIDECVGDKHDCDENASCTNTEGSYSCLCNQGYMGDGKQCLDVDECKDGTDLCDLNAQCVNNEGSYDCTCTKGFLVCISAEN